MFCIFLFHKKCKGLLKGPIVPEYRSNLGMSMTASCLNFLLRMWPLYLHNNNEGGCILCNWYYSILCIPGHSSNGKNLVTVKEKQRV